MYPKTSLSVVIPFYNETAFIETAVYSVLSQRLDNVEILIINDNPDAFKQSYFDSLDFPDCVKVIHHKRNLGLPSSRNTGIDAAKGTHIAFLDADDYYLPLGLRNHFAYAVRNEADITHAQTVITNVNRTSGAVIAPDMAYMNQKSQGRYEKPDVIQAGFYIESSWASIYRADFLATKGVRFDESQVKFEDRIFVVEALVEADSLAIMGTPCRVWRKRNDSITTSAKSFDDQLLKLNLVRKSVNIWLNKGGDYNRHWAMQEFVRQAGYMITKNETSPWYGAFGFSESEEDTQLTEMLTAFFAELNVTEADVIAAFDAKSPKYAPERTGQGKITPQDMFRFIDSVARADYPTTRQLVLATHARPRPFQLAHFPRSAQDAPRILLHFGLHKTGSTHIQYQLEQNRRVLRDHSVLFPHTGFGFAEGREPVRPGGLPGHQALISAIFQKKDRALMLKQLEGEVLGSQCETIIISAENLSQPDATYATRARRVREVVEALSAIGPVTPVIMYRRADRWLESYYREVTGNGAATAYQTPGEFLVNNKALLNFDNIVGAIEDACRERAILFSFEDALRKYNDLTLAFLDQCGHTIPEQKLVLTSDTRYPSTCNAQLQIARLTSLLVPDKDTRQSILRTFYAQAQDSGQKTPLFTPDQQRQIIHSFCDCAKATFDTHGIASPRADWLENIEETDLPDETQIPEQHIAALWVSGVMNGSNIQSLPLTQEVPPQPMKLENVAEINLEHLARMTQENSESEHIRRELDYMQNSFSWRITTPLRTVMRRYKKLRGIA